MKTCDELVQRLNDTMLLSKIITSGPLIQTDYASYNGEFYSQDTENKLYDNTKRFAANGIHWEYADKYIHYNFNNQGYRTKDWNNIDWENSIVLHGCSFIVGEGLAEEDTISAQLSNLTGKYVVNLGISGSGIMLNAHNSVMLCKNLPTPAAVVQVWSGINRIELYTEDSLLLCVPGTYGKPDRYMGKYCDEYYKNWIHIQENYITQLWFHINSTRLLWESKTKYYECTLHGETANKLNLAMAPIVDYARDLQHPGIASAKLIAAHIAENIS